MLAKTLTFAAIAGLLFANADTITDRLEPIFQEATAVATLSQKHELETSLELYYLDYGQYPDVSEADLAKTLYSHDYLKKDRLEYNFDYSVGPDKQHYTLTSL